MIGLISEENCWPKAKQCPYQHYYGSLSTELTPPPQEWSWCRVIRHLLGRIKKVVFSIYLPKKEVEGVGSVRNYFYQMHKFCIRRA
jgi:hypothetical protein